MTDKKPIARIVEEYIQHFGEETEIPDGIPNSIRGEKHYYPETYQEILESLPKLAFKAEFQHLYRSTVQLIQSALMSEIEKITFGTEGEGNDEVRSYRRQAEHSYITLRGTGIEPRGAYEMSMINLIDLILEVQNGTYKIEAVEDTARIHTEEEIEEMEREELHHDVDPPFPDDM